MGVMLWPVGLALMAVGVGIGVPVKAMRWVGRFLIAGLLVSLATLWAGFWHVADPLALWFFSIVAVLSVMGLWYSEPYVAVEATLHQWSGSRIRGYSVLLYAFIASLLAVALITNFLALWLAIEAATLTSVFLTGIPGDAPSTEAAWKYLFVTEAGGFVALVGTLMVLVMGGWSLDAWSYSPPVTHMGPVAPHWVLIGVLLALVGYAAKAGLAPFHTWLPDAHSEAPAPVSALLSGLKLAGAILIAFRLMHLASAMVPGIWLQDALIILGLASLLVAASFVAFQRDLKRLWAYSSIEHIGLIALGMGFGGIALIGAVLHIWTHAASKTLLFHNAGTVRLLYHSSRRDGGARALLQRTPWTGGLLALGSAAILGLPPMAPFWSEWLILAGGFQHSFDRLPVILAIVFLVAIFMGVARRLPEWLWRPGPFASIDPPVARIREPWSLIVPSVVLAVLVVGGGIGVPWVAPALWHHLVGSLKTYTL